MLELTALIPLLFLISLIGMLLMITIMKTMIKYDYGKNRIKELKK